VWRRRRAEHARRAVDRYPSDADGNRVYRKRQGNGRNVWRYGVDQEQYAARCGVHERWRVTGLCSDQHGDGGRNGRVSRDNNG
jgi:hypothetical protein